MERLKKARIRRVKFLRSRGQSMVAVIAALAAAMVVTLGVLQSTKYFSRNIKGVEESVKFNNWTSTMLSVLQGGFSKSSGGNFSCSNAFSGQLFTVGNCTTVPFLWPAYCRAGPKVDQAACGATWQSSVFLSGSGTKEGVATTLQVCMGSTVLADYGSAGQVYQATLKLTGTKNVVSTGGANTLHWDQVFYPIFLNTGGGNYKIVDCTLNLPTPTPIPQTGPGASQTSATPTPAPDWCATSSGYALQAGTPSSWSQTFTHLAQGTTATMFIRIPHSGITGVNFEVIGAGGQGYAYNTNDGSGSKFGGGGGGSGGYMNGNFHLYSPTRDYCFEVVWGWSASGTNSFLAVDYVYGIWPNHYRIANVNNAASANSNIGGAAGGPNPNYCTDNLFGYTTSCNTRPGLHGFAGVANSNMDCGGDGATESCSGTTNKSCGTGGTRGGFNDNTNSCNWSGNAGSGTNYGAGGGGGGYSPNQPNSAAEGAPGVVTLWW